MKLIYIPILLLLFSFYIKATPNEVGRLASISKHTEQIVEQYKALDWFTGSILLAKDGHVFYTYNHGKQNMTTGINNSSNTRYNLGSIMKDFTDVLILKAAEEGKIKLSDTIDKYNLGFTNPDTANVTVAHLVEHTSGLPDIFNAEYRQNPLLFDTVQKRLELLLDTELLFEPGSDKKYSNYGYVVLGAILERVYGITFPSLLEQKIFLPAKMTNSQFLVDLQHPLQSTRYSYQFDNSQKEVGMTEYPGPDGGIESSVYDLHKFYRALFYSNTLLDNSNPTNREVFKMDGKKWRSYGGGMGVSSAAEINLENGFDVIVLTNTDSLIAEFISQRIMAFIETGKFEKIMAKEVNFIYQHYISQQPKKSFDYLNERYKEAGYTLFIGRTLNELGMQLVRIERWQQAFDTFNYLKTLFPNAPQVYDSLAFTYYKKGDLEKAKVTFDKALAINANFNSDYISNNYRH